MRIGLRSFIADWGRRKKGKGMRGGVVMAGVLWVGVVAAESWGCPMCSESLPNGTQGGGEGSKQVEGRPGAGEGGRELARGFYYSILLMLAVPGCVAGGFGFMFYRVVKQAEARRAGRAGDAWAGAQGGAAAAARG